LSPFSHRHLRICLSPRLFRTRSDLHPLSVFKDSGPFHRPATSFFLLLSFPSLAYSFRYCLRMGNPPIIFPLSPEPLCELLPGLFPQVCSTSRVLFLGSFYPPSTDDYGLICPPGLSPRKFYVLLGDAAVWRRTSLPRRPLERPVFILSLLFVTLLDGPLDPASFQFFSLPFILPRRFLLFPALVFRYTRWSSSLSLKEVQALRVARHFFCFFDDKL